MDPVERAKMLSRRRIKATEQMWDEQVKKLERVALHADGVADTRAHEIHVLRRASYKKGAAVRNSRNVLSSSSGVYDPDTAESQREALRETMLDCIRREEMVRVQERADKERDLAARRADEAVQKRDEARRAVMSKVEQEVEINAHREEVEAERRQREEEGSKYREEMAKQKAAEKKELAEVRTKKIDEAARIAADRRVANEAKAKMKVEEQERQLEEREKAAKEKLAAKALAAEVKRKEAALEYSRRLEKVWKKAVADADAAEARYDKLAMSAEHRQSSFTAEELERLEQRMKLTRVRADAAKESFHNCVYQYKGIVKEDEDGGGEGK